MRDVYGRKFSIDSIVSTRPLNDGEDEPRKDQHKEHTPFKLTWTGCIGRGLFGLALSIIGIAVFLPSKIASQNNAIGFSILLLFVGGLMWLSNCGEK